MAAAWALGQFMAADGTVGATSTDAVGLGNAVAMAQALVSVTTGVAPGTGFAGTATAPVAKLNTLANLLSVCAAGSSACDGVLGGAAVGGVTPVDTLGVAVGLAHAPATGVHGLYGLAAGATVYAPALSVEPPDWTLAMTYAGGGLIAPTAAGVQGPTALAIDAGGEAWVANYGGVLSAFSPVGVPLFASGLTGGGMGDSYGLAIGPTGDVWVSNTDANSVTVWSAAGAVVGTYATGGLDHPLGVAIAPGVVMCGWRTTGMRR